MAAGGEGGCPREWVGVVSVVGGAEDSVVAMPIVGVGSHSIVESVVSACCDLLSFKGILGLSLEIFINFK
ncbi:unnamed protein product [Meloidogyne enterolobii]|uniref:Uncharacterized protein n=1 Tax=Meloidogyne enterolobii TaxID=390850 RepID=A0ACB0YZI5_MELEN